MTITSDIFCSLIFMDPLFRVNVSVKGAWKKTWSWKKVSWHKKIESAIPLFINYFAILFLYFQRSYCIIIANISYTNHRKNTNTQLSTSTLNKIEKKQFNSIVSASILYNPWAEYTLCLERGGGAPPGGGEWFSYYATLYGCKISFNVCHRREDIYIFSNMLTLCVMLLQIKHFV